MTKMAAMPINGRNTEIIFFPGTSGPISTKLGMKHQRLKLTLSCSNDNPWVELDIFYSKVKFCNLGFYMGKCDNYLEIIASCDLEFGLCSKLND